MKRMSFFNLVLLFFSWNVYASCQNDYGLIYLCGSIVFLSWIMRLKSIEKDYALFAGFPLSAVIMLSVFAGMIWRTFVPIPEDAVSPFPEFTAALQTGSVFAAVLLWLRPFSQKNFYRLVFCSWLTVALSINVLFTQDMLLMFSAFCFVAIAIVLLCSIQRPSEKKYMFLYWRDYFIFSTVLIMATMLLFLGISRSIVAFENAFFNTMSNYILPRNYTHFLRLSPKLNLISPGMSAFDRRPLLEVSVPGTTNTYLKLQVFDRYENGTWQESADEQRSIIPDKLPQGQPIGKMMMFTSFKDVVPLPGRIAAVEGENAYFKSKTHIVYDQKEKPTRMLKFSFIPDFSTQDAVNLSEDEQRIYTQVPLAIALELKSIAQDIVGNETDPKEKTIKLVEYFQNNFQYSLEVSFSADDQGLLKMLKEKKPAYCTYFASALALLLRSEGIPARVAAGLSTTEIINRKNNTFLARINNAHAWTELLLPVKDPVTGLTYQAWHRADATPTNFSAQLQKNSRIDLERFLENTWLGILRLNARFQNIDKNKTKIFFVCLLLAVMALINRKNITAAIRQWLRRQKSAPAIRYHSPDALRTIYERYERILKEQYDATRGRCETDSEVLERIRNKLGSDTASMVHIHEFIREFHKRRFGDTPSRDIEKILQKTQKSIK